MTDPDIYRDGKWVAVATAPGGDPGRSLQPIYDVLEAAGIPVGFDPYRPGVASSPYPAPYRAFNVVVPESLRERALQIIHEAGIVVPGEPRSDTIFSQGPAPAGDFSDRVLDQDVETERRERRRRSTAVLVAVILIITIIASMLEVVLRVFSSSSF